jgi:serine/threonine protein phosphatase 1
MTRYAIGDIHGGARTFRALLEKIDLQRNDRVYLLGDYVDRGPNSKGVLDIILRLLDAGFDIRPLRGNHESMFIRAIHGDRSDETRIYMQSWGADTLKSFGITNPRDIPAYYRFFLRGLPLILEDDQFIFVHASLDMSKEDPITQTSTEYMLWGDDGFVSDNEIPGRIIVSGHRIRTVGFIKESLDQPHIQIDNGAFSNQPPEFGHLVALNLDSMQLTFQRWVDKEAAKPNQSMILA